MDRPSVLNQPTFEERWSRVQAVRQEFAAELDQMAAELPKEGGRHLQLLSRWFKGAADSDAALNQPDVLAISMPMLNTEDSIAPGDLKQFARAGYCALGPNLSFGRRLIRLFIYPILILFLGGLLAVGFSYWIAPEFEEIFGEFGIELPAITMWVLRCARIVRFTAPFIIGIPVAVFFLMLLSSQKWGSRDVSNLSWLDRRFMSTRNALGAWAWHISLLLEAGIPLPQSIRTAGETTGNAWLKRVSMKRNEEEEQQAGLLFYENFHLLDCALRLPLSPGKIAVLREIATYYWDRNNSFGDWWMKLFVSLILWFFVVMIMTCIIALFLPLISVVSGLTGGGGGIF